MKRNYIKPECFCLDDNLNTNLLIVSGAINENGKNGIGTNTSNQTGTGGGGTSREGSLFEDDDYDF